MKKTVPKDIQSCIADLPKRETPDQMKKTIPKDIQSCIADLPKRETPDQMKKTIPKDIQSCIADLPKRETPAQMKKTVPKDIQSCIADLPKRETPAQMKKTATKDIQSCIADLPKRETPEQSLENLLRSTEDHEKVYHHAVLIDPRYWKQGQEVLQNFLNVLASSRKTLRLATFKLGGEVIIHRLVQAAQRGVLVEVIVDTLEENIVQRLEQAGIHLRIYQQSRAAREPHNQDAIFHQKYLIVDDRYLMYGSCNLSELSFTGHHEDLVSTNDVRFVQPFSVEFRARWAEFSP
ncbi:hypothetical protein BV898_18773 [Hypsibius exemplaris]|uniref:Mitochondrial cardiolipin hydrolase n=1 Tax=Hypsibius exemplaris TaxID=2072580 RepID=A0A9X6NQN6_HYPEX|nr:hypothetical protein BV898_18773 [Hypsibius exemplaris]